MSRKGWRSPLVALRVAGSSLILVLYSWLFLLPSSREASVLDLLPGLQLFPALERLAVAPSLRLAAGAGLGAIVVIIVMLLATLTLGRVYCSFLCPLGAFQDGLVALRRAFPGKRARFFRYRPGRPLVHAAAFSLVAVAALAGLPLLLGLVEPWAAFGKLASAVLRPAAALANNVAAALARAFGSWDLAPGPIPWEPVQGFEGIMICLALFALVMTRGRIFCNLLCPTGAILRFLSSKPLFRLRVDKGSCTACGACSRACRASCISEPERGAAEAPAIDEARCIRCFDCVAVCPSRSIAFSAKALAAARIPRGPAAGARAAGARAAGARAADAGAADAGRRSFLRSATNWSGVAAFLLAGGAGFVASRIGRAAGPARAAGSADDAGDAGAS
ncbi:MAG: 4Fe-4S binding protein, partial [Spirochaetota bacterium]